MARYEFAIIGLGKFGIHLGKTLARAGKRVLCIDRQEELVQKISEDVTDAVVADGSDKEVLESLGMADIETVIVAVGDMTHSVLIALYLRELGVNKILAKANDEDHSKLLSLVGAHRVIIPERNAAKDMANSLLSPNIVDFLPMLEGYVIAQLEPPKPFLGHSLEELQLRKKYHVYVLAIQNKQTNEMNLMPSARHILHKNEIVYVLGKREDVDKLQKI